LTGVLVAYDGSPTARRALSRACELGRAGTVVTVIHVLGAPGLSARLGAGLEARQEQRELLDEAQEWMARNGFAGATLAATGSPVREILDAAQRMSVDLVVVGRGSGRVPHVASISGELVRRAGCDVLVVHPAPDGGA
jgi:nucleotide-binding universal stress UspA family protein